MSLVIINADDFGYSQGINLGIIEAHKNGILSSTTMMANMPGFEHGVELAKNNPKLGIGVHLNLTCGKPLLDNVPSLTDYKEFRNLSYYEKETELDEGEIYREWDAQINKIKNAGIVPTHLDSHHHINRIAPINEIFIKLAREYNLPVRNNFDVPKDIKTVKKFFTEFDAIGMNKEIWKGMTISNLIQDCKMYKSVEVMCHPGYIDDVVLKTSSLTDNRAYTTMELKKISYKEILDKNSIKIGTFNDLE